MVKLWGGLIGGLLGQGYFEGRFSVLPFFYGLVFSGANLAASPVRARLMVAVEISAGGFYFDVKDAAGGVRRFWGVSVVREKAGEQLFDFQAVDVGGARAVSEVLGGDAVDSVRRRC